MVWPHERAREREEAWANLANRRCRRDAIYEQKVIYPFGITHYIHHDVLGCVVQPTGIPRVSNVYNLLTGNTEIGGYNDSLGDWQKVSLEPTVPF